MIAATLLILSLSHQPNSALEPAYNTPSKQVRNLSGSALEAGFKNPPDSAKPHTWWHWMNGNVTREGITADLEAMKAAGIGGAQMFTVPEGIPAGPAGYMSQQWRDLTKWAVQEAGRLGIELCLHNCAGWSSSGGPWITPENAMQVVAWSQKSVRGPSRFSEKLPEAKAPQVFRQVPYYKDIAVYAIPEITEGDAPHLGRQSPALGKTGVVRQDGLDPDLSPGPAGFAVPKNKIVDLTSMLSADGALTWDVPPGNWTILRMGHVPTGKNNHPAPPEGDGLEVDKLSRDALLAHWNGMMAKVIADVGPLAGKVLNNSLIDSYEVGSQNWSATLPYEFKQRRGYDMMPFLPALAGVPIESKEVTERFLWDLRRTIADVFADNYYGFFGYLCHKAGMQFSTEPYGSGGFDDIQAGGRSDIPMGEFWIGGGAMETTKIASSTGHVYGRKIVGAEAFTASEGQGKFTVEPYGIKAIGDFVFTQGINRYIFHRYAMQPWTDLKPGMTMGPWGSHFDRTQTWWPMAGAWLTYVARCQFMLQQGLFGADVLYFYGDNGPNTLAPRQNLKPAMPEGYDYDGCDATVVRQRLSVKNGRLTLPDGMSYRLLVLPESKFMTLETLASIRKLVKAGAWVLGPKPEHTPGLGNYVNDEDTMRFITRQLWGSDSNSATGHAYGKGRVFQNVPIGNVLKQAKLEPDFEFMGFGGATRLVYIRRDIGNARAYFVSNQRYQAADVELTFRVGGRQPELWHADTGRIEPAPVWSESGGRTTIPMRLSPAESVFVVFRKPAPKDHLVLFQYGKSRAEIPLPKIVIKSARYEAADGRGADVTEIVARLVKQGNTEIPATNGVFGDPVVNVVKRLVVEYELDGKPVKQTVAENETMVLVKLPDEPPGPPEFLLEAKGDGSVLATLFGKGSIVNSTAKLPRILLEKGPLKGATDHPVEGVWQISFPPNLGAPAEARFPKLQSWSVSDDPGIKYFSGIATYAKRFVLPAGAVAKERRQFLDLGRVKNLARVKLNGKDLGIVWKEPFWVEVTGVALDGLNRLEVQVANGWTNRLIGDEQLSPDVEWAGNRLKEWPAWLTPGVPNAGANRPATGRVAFSTWRYYTKDSPLLESGLLGPVVLRSAPVVRVR